MSKIAHSISEKARTGDVQITESVDFGSLLLSDNVLKGLKNSGFVRPSPIQLKAIPLGRCGLDLIVQAKSGTGKTCVFSVIALESIATDTASTQVLVLAPTREIAVQIWEVINSIGSAMKGLECHTFIGGLPLHEDRIKLKKCHIAVGSPGRIKQLIEGGVLKTDSLRLFILDEADKLLEESFQEQINWIYSTLPENKQMLALSATYPEYLAEHLTAYMRNPTFLRLNISDPALLGIRQYYQTVAYHPLSHVVFEEKTKVLCNILSSISFQQCLVFSNLQTRAQTLADSLTSHGWPTACIAGCLDQKDRNHAMAKLKTYKCRILISTDLTSRGIDADKVNMVINLDVPHDHETYLHRIGRAGRFGSFGIAVTLVSDGQEKLNLDAIEKRCNTQIYPMPDPIPSDLAKPDSPVFLDDVVSSEVINTEKTSHCSGSLRQKVRSSPKSEVLDDITYTNRNDYNPHAKKKCIDNGMDTGSLENMKNATDDVKETVEFQSKELLENYLTETEVFNDRKDEEVFKNHVETRAPVNYDDVEYIEMNEKIDSDIEKLGTVTNMKIDKSLNEMSTKGKLVASPVERKPSKMVSLTLSLTGFEGKDKSLSTERQIHNGKFEKLDNELRLVKQEDLTSKHVLTNDINGGNEGNNLRENCKTAGVQALRSCKLSSLSFERVDISTVFKHNIGFKNLNRHHSYESARESLNNFREQIDTGKQMMDSKSNCSIPKVENLNIESDTLKHAIFQLQDLLESRLCINGKETVSAEEVPESTTDSISSEDEFEAKEEVLHQKAFTLAPNIVSEEQNVCDNQVFDKLEEKLDLEERMSGSQGRIKEKIQKPKKHRKQRYGFQGNFAIGHLLQQERSQELENENINDVEQVAAWDVPKQESACRSKMVDTVEINTSVKEFPPQDCEVGFGVRQDSLQGISMNHEEISEPNSFEHVTEEDPMSLVRNEKKNIPYGTDSDRCKNLVASNIKVEDKESDSDSMPSTSDSESTDHGAKPKRYQATKESLNRKSKQTDTVGSHRYNVKSDSKSEDSGVFSRPSYQEQWRRWYEQYDNWHQQSRNMWGYSCMNQYPIQDDGRASGYGHPDWHSQTQSMYYPYQNYHHSFPYDYSMYPRPDYRHNNSSNLTEQIGNAFHFQEEYLKRMSKNCFKKNKNM